MDALLEVIGYNNGSNSVLTCKGCRNLVNRQTDTVKVDIQKILDDRDDDARAAAGKENGDPRIVAKSECKFDSPPRKNALGENNIHRQQQQRQLEVQLDQADEEARLAVEEEEARAMVEQAKQQAALEERRREWEARQEEERAQARRKKQEEEEQMRRRRALEEEERLRREQEEVARRQQREREDEQQRLRRLAEEEEQQAAEAWQRQQAEEAAKKEELRAFLDKNGFQTPIEKKLKKGMFTSSVFAYPLHAAVEANDVEAVQLLLWAGADPTLPNSKKLTPLRLAEAKNKANSHGKMISELGRAEVIAARQKRGLGGGLSTR